MLARLRSPWSEMLDQRSSIQQEDSTGSAVLNSRAQPRSFDDASRQPSNSIFQNPNQVAACHQLASIVPSKGSSL